MAKSQMNGVRSSPLMQEWSNAMKVEMTAKKFAEYTEYLDRRRPNLVESGLIYVKRLQIIAIPIKQ